MTPAISVLVPAFNDAAFLEASLESLAGQSFRDFEVIVADDASSDATPEIARSWEQRDGRFRLSRLESNAGMTGNWNRALAEARGDLVLKLDADDAMAPRTLEVLTVEFGRTSGLLFAACRTLDCDLDLWPVGPFRGDLAFRRRGEDPEGSRLRGGIEWLRLCFDDIQLWTSDALLFGRRDLLALGGWDERLVTSDTDLILRALALDRPVFHSGYAGIFYRRRGGSSSDREQRSGVARVEGTMIALRTLAAHGAKLARGDRALRQNWWRLWRRFGTERIELEHLTGLTPERRASLAALALEIAQLSPPRGVLLEGAMREKLWQARRALLGGR